MTLVHFDLRRGNFSTPTVGSVWVAPVKRVHVNETPDYIALPDPVEYPLTDGQVDIELRPNDVDWAWVCFEGVDAGITRTFAVPDSASTLDYGDLIDIDPTTLTPSAEPEAAWWAMANSLPATAVVTGDNLIITRVDGSTYSAGNVRGLQGLPGDKGDKGDTGDSGDKTTSLTSNVSGAVAIGTAAGPTTRNWTLTGNITSFTLNGTPSSNTSYTITAVIRQNSSATSWTIVWPTNVKWAEGLTPPVPAAPNAIGVYHFLWTGVDWLGFTGGINFA